MRIYTLHSVADNGLSLSLRHFRRFVSYLARRYTLVGPDALIAEPDDQSALLTFDDCFADNFSNAVPTLEEFGVKALFFFSPAFLGKVRWGSAVHGRWSDDASGDFSIPYAYMGIAELHALRALGHEIGFHSRTHSNLTECSDAQLRDEIIDAKAEWEARLGFEFRYFAYPRGKHDARMFPLAAEAGYRCALTTVPAAADRTSFRERPFSVPRLPVQRKGLFGWL